MMQFVVGREHARQRFDRFLGAFLPQVSRSRVQALIAEGCILLNGKPAKASESVRTGDIATVEIPPERPAEAQAEDIPLDILYEDADLLVLNKPPGLVVHPAAGHWQGTLVNALLHHCGALSSVGGVQRPGIVHRLDKETSGCLVVAKNDAAHESLTRQFAGRSVSKIYLALAAGEFREKRGVLESAIGRHPVHRKKMAVVAEGRGKPAKTSYRVLAGLAGFSLVECELHTGRTHQIRVHLKQLGHPVCGDALYGARGSWPRQMLHAWKLGFIHPRTGEALHFESPVPPDFAEAAQLSTKQ